MTSRYAASQESFRNYEQGMRWRLARLMLDFLDRRTVVVLYRRLYREFRRCYGPDLVQALAVPVAGSLRQGLGPDLALEVTRESSEQMGRPLGPVQLRELRRIVRTDFATNKEENVTKSAVAESVTPKPADARPARRVSRSQEAVAFLMDETPLEVQRRENGLKGLRDALVRFQPVVKRCVVRRLIDRLSYAKLPAELRLSRDQVQEILSQLKPWVAKYTTYFDDDWYWFEGRTPDLGPAAVGKKEEQCT